jgi:hypothetical protein
LHSGSVLLSKRGRAEPLVAAASQDRHRRGGVFPDTHSATEFFIPAHTTLQIELILLVVQINCHLNKTVLGRTVRHVAAAAVPGAPASSI